MGELGLALAEEHHELRVGLVGERVAFRDGVSLLAVGVHIDAEHLAVPGALVLPGFEHVALPAAVADGDIEITIRAESDFAAVVVAVGEVDFHDRSGRGHVGLVRVIGLHLVFDYVG